MIKKVLVGLFVLILVIVACATDSVTKSDSAEDSTSFGLTPTKAFKNYTTIRITYDWNTGYCAEVDLYNRDTAVQTWIYTDINLYDAKIYDSWYTTPPTAATFSKTTGTSRVTANSPATVAPNAKIGFGFCANKGPTGKKFTVINTESSIPNLPPPPTCTSFTYSGWSTCVNLVQTRTSTSSSPVGCTGGTPILSQACTPPPTFGDSFRTGSDLINLGDLQGADWWGTTAGPPTSGRYPVLSTALLDAMQARNIKVVRILFSWEAMQKDLLGPLSNTGANGYLTYYTRLKTVVDGALARGMYVVIEEFQQDPNAVANFGSFKYDTGPCYKGVYIGHGSVTTAAYADFHAKMATLFSYDNRIAFGLLNEPHTGNTVDSTMTTDSWFKFAQAAIVAIRATGSTNTILVPGIDFDKTYWTDASWKGDASSATGWAANINDPLNKTMIEVHNYNGLYNTTIGSPADSMSEVVTWARARGLKVFVGEVAIDDGAPTGTNANAVAKWSNWSSYAVTNKDVIVGWCWWATGELGWWSNADSSGGSNWGLFIYDSNHTSYRDSIYMTLIKNTFVATPY